MTWFTRLVVGVRDQRFPDLEEFGPLVSLAFEIKTLVISERFYLQKDYGDRVPQSRTTVTKLNVYLVAYSSLYSVSLESEKGRLPLSWRLLSFRDRSSSVLIRRKACWFSILKIVLY
jgi:hypothetical protein